MLGYHGYYTYYIHLASRFATSANIGNKAVGVLGTGVPRLACLWPTVWLI